MALKDIGFKYRESGLVVQALKALGKEHINHETIFIIRQRLNSGQQILKDTAPVTDWVYDYIKKICHGDE